MKGKGAYELNDYAAEAEAFLEYLDGIDLNFRGEMAAYMKARRTGDPELVVREIAKLAWASRTRGKDAPAPAGPSGIEKLLKAVAAPAKPAREPLPPGRRPNQGGGNPGKWIVDDDAPGKLLTPPEVRAACGLPAGRNIRPYLINGWRIGGGQGRGKDKKGRLFRYATKQEIDAALGAAAVHKPSPRLSTKGARS